jgi:hypothetical protein
MAKRTRPPSSATPEAIRIRCYGCKQALVGTRPLNEVVTTPLPSEARADSPLTEAETIRGRLHAYYDTLIRDHWKLMMGPEDWKRHTLPMPIPGYEAIEILEPLDARIERCTDKGFTGRGYTDGTNYIAAVVPDKKNDVVLVLASRLNRRVVIERVFQGPIDQAVDVAMEYKITKLAGPDALRFGTFALAPLPDPETARNLHLLIDRAEVVLPNLRFEDGEIAPGSVLDGLLTGSAVGRAVEAAASITAKGVGKTWAHVHHRNHLDERLQWAFHHKVQDAF